MGFSLLQTYCTIGYFQFMKIQELDFIYLGKENNFLPNIRKQKKYVKYYRDFRYS